MSLSSLPSRETNEQMIQEGDALLIIRPGGEIVTMTYGVDKALADAAASKQPEEMTQEEVDVAIQGQTLFLLTMAAQSEVVMEVLAKVAVAPGGPSYEAFKQATRMN